MSDLTLEEKTRCAASRATEIEAEKHFFDQNFANHVRIAATSARRETLARSIAGLIAQAWGLRLTLRCRWFPANAA